MKHAEHILVVDESAVEVFSPDLLNTPFVMVDGGLVERLSSANGYFSIRRRLEMDASEKRDDLVGRYRQVLPYLVLNRDGKLYAYQRAKGIGEDRLLGKKSIGLGGHVDITDVAFSKDGVLDFRQTISKAISRELAEEVSFSDESFNPLGRAVVVGMINDTSDSVGRDHLGIVVRIDLPAEIDVTIKESELVHLGFLSLTELLEDCDAFESWSKILIQPS